MQMYPHCIFSQTFIFPRLKYKIESKQKTMPDGHAARQGSTGRTSALALLKNGVTFAYRDS